MLPQTSGRSAGSRVAAPGTGLSGGANRLEHAERQQVAVVDGSRSGLLQAGSKEIGATLPASGPGDGTEYAQTKGLPDHPQTVGQQTASPEDLTGDARHQPTALHGRLVSSRLPLPRVEILLPLQFILSVRPRRASSGVDSQCSKALAVLREACCGGALHREGAQSRRRRRAEVGRTRQ